MGVIILLPEYLYFSPSHLTLLNIIKIKVLKKDHSFFVDSVYHLCGLKTSPPKECYYSPLGRRR